jgi:hypothetical protein
MDDLNTGLFQNSVPVFQDLLLRDTSSKGRIIPETPRQRDDSYRVRLNPETPRLRDSSSKTFRSAHTGGSGIK